jgi:hypothetical protein
MTWGYLLAPRENTTMLSPAVKVKRVVADVVSRKVTISNLTPRSSQSRHQQVAMKFSPAQSQSALRQ